MRSMACKTTSFEPQCRQLFKWPRHLIEVFKAAKLHINFRMLTTVQTCLAFHSDCSDDISVNLMASITTELDTCPPPIDPNECADVSLYVACYSELITYLQGCGFFGCSTQQGCL